MVNPQSLEDDELTFIGRDAIIRNKELGNKTHFSCGKIKISVGWMHHQFPANRGLPILCHPQNNIRSVGTPLSSISSAFPSAPFMTVNA